MLNMAEEKLLSKIVGFGAAFTTIFIISGSVTDPVNVTKLASLGVTSFAALGVLSINSLLPKFLEFFPVWTTLVIFIIAALSSVVMSESPLSQNLYGSF